jgi:hypothetical protein
VEQQGVLITVEYVIPILQTIVMLTVLALGGAQQWSTTVTYAVEIVHKTAEVYGAGT